MAQIESRAPGPAPAKGWPWRRRIVVALALLAGFAISGGAFMVVRRLERERTRGEFEQRARALAASLRKNLGSYLETVAALVRFYDASELVSRTEFGLFVRGEIESHPGLLALEWAPRVRLADRDAFEAEVRAEGFPGFRITERNAGGVIVPAGPRAEYIPVTFMAPEMRDTVAGFDLASEEERRAALRLARDLARPVATRRLRLVQEDKDPYGFLIVAPVYVNGAPRETPSERRANLAGYVLGVFDITEMVKASLFGVDFQDIDLHIYDANAEPGRDFIYHHMGNLPSGEEAECRGSAPGGMFHETIMNMGGRRWTALFHPAGSFWTASPAPLSAAVLLLSCLLTVVLTILLAREMTRSLRVEREVDSRTEELSKVNRRLEEDIAERRRVEAALRDAMSLQEGILSGASHAIILTGLDGVIRVFNAAAERMLGYPAAEIEGRATPLLFHDPEGLRERAAALSRELGREIEPGLEAFAAKALAGIPDESEWVFLRKDGSRLHALLSITALRGPGGETTGLLGIAADITGRKTAERHFDQFFSLSLDLLCIAGFDGYFKRLNPAWESTLGYSNEELMAKPFLRFVHPEDAAATIEQTASIARGRDAVHFENRYLHKDGSVRWLLWSATPSPTERLIFAAARDITERKMAEGEIARARDAALESARLKSAFVANMSHEIRTPMNAIIGFTDLLLGGKTTPVQRDHLSVVKSSADALLLIINDVLDFSKIEAGGLRLETLDFNLAVAVEDVVQMLGERAHARGLAFSSFIHPGVPVHLRGDPHRLRQILVNLAGNAIKFTEKGEVAIRVALEGETAHHARVRFEVRDTGIGIREDARRFLFHPFSQADPSMTRRYGGTGLGLAISKQLAELMGGEIGVESGPEEGSLFWFTVPLAKQWRAASPPPGRAALEGAPVLVAGGDEALVRNVEDMTRGWGMKAEIARTAAEALERIRSAADRGDPFRFAVIQAALPGMDGMELAARVKEAAPGAPVRTILIASFGRALALREANESGVDALLSQPLRQSELFAALTRALADAARIERPRPEPAEGEPAAPRGPRLPAPNRPGHPRILVAEDNPVNQKVVLAQLSGLGYDADLAADGAEALRAASETVYDIILMDCQMPNLDGYSAAEAIRALDPGRPRPFIVALTANAMAGEREKCLASGMNDYLAKPVRLADLEETLRRWTREAGLEPPPPRRASPARPAAASGAGPLDPVVASALREYPSATHPNLFAELCDCFLREAGERIKALREAAERGDGRAARLIAHALKGSAGNLGAKPLSALCRELEDRLEIAPRSPDTLLVLDALDAELARVREAFRMEAGAVEPASSPS